MVRQLPNDLPKFNDDLNKPKTNAGRIKQTRKYRLITPLFGGGVEAKKADPVKVIRETSVRGQLRFWWRAMRGVGTLAQMKEREDKLFGSSSGSNGAQHSQVLIAVTECSRGIEISPNNAPRYASFPLEANDTLRKDITFILQITFPKAEQIEVEAALWAWETFGGVGGRTRRGFGALQRTDVNLPTPAELKTNLTTEFNTYFAQGDWNDEAEFPRLQSLVIDDNFAARVFNERNEDGSPKNNCDNAWKHLIQNLQNFRQSPRIDGGFTGESHWSEPDAIRSIVGTHARHNPPRSKDRAPTHSVGLNRKFPRAQFGLPIIFKFKEDRDGDPQPQTVKPRIYERLSSPLILRPIACANGEAVAFALILKTPPLPDVELQGYGSVNPYLDGSDIAGIRPMTFGGNTTETDVLKMFLKII